MQVEDEVGDAVRGEPADDAPDHRLAGDRDRRLGADVGEWTESSTEARGKDQGVSDHNAIARICRGPAYTRQISARTNTYMVKHSKANAGKPR